MSRPAAMLIDLGALKHNLRRVKQLAPKSQIIAMVKANAYGHGLVRVAEALQEADAFGVASVEEGICLREAGIKTPIVLMEGLFSKEEIHDAAKHAFTLVIHHLPHIEMLEQTPVDYKFNVWLKINTGMHRLGIQVDEVQNAYERLEKLACVRQPIGLMTHFAQADNLKNQATDNQIQAFNNVTHIFSGPESLANSAGILGWPGSHGDWVRPGLMLYGASPFLDQNGEHLNLRPVMTLTSKIIAITKVQEGGKVGYGGTWTAPEDMFVGVIGIGYGDGYPQFAKNGTPVLLNGKRVSLVGRVSMDMLTVDLRTQPEAKVGDPVILWGNGLPVEVIARYSNTSAYEILTRMTPRPKVEVKSEVNIQENHTERLV